MTNNESQWSHNRFTCSTCLYYVSKNAFIGRCYFHPPHPIRKGRPQVKPDEQGCAEHIIRAEKKMINIIIATDDEGLDAPRYYVVDFGAGVHHYHVVDRTTGKAVYTIDQMDKANSKCDYLNSQEAKDD